MTVSLRVILKILLLIILLVPNLSWAQCGQQGYTIVGSNIVSQTPNYYGIKFALGSGGQIGSIWVYDGGSGGTSIIAALYSDNGSGTGPTTRLDTSVSQYVYAGGWQVCP